MDTFGTRVDHECPGWADAGISLEEVVSFDFMDEENVELPLVWSLAVAWHALWKLRLNKTRPQLYFILGASRTVSQSFTS